MFCNIMGHLITFPKFWAGFLAAITKQLSNVEICPWASIIWPNCCSRFKHALTCTVSKEPEFTAAIRVRLANMAITRTPVVWSVCLSQKKFCFATPFGHRSARSRTCWSASYFRYWVIATRMWRFRPGYLSWDWQFGQQKIPSGRADPQLSSLSAQKGVYLSVEWSKELLQDSNRID
jgi:hypothetical protein